MCSLIPMRPLAFFSLSSYFLPALFFSKLGVFPIKGMGARAQTAIYACISQWGQIKFKISLELNNNYNFTIFFNPN